MNPFGGLTFLSGAFLAALAAAALPTVIHLLNRRRHRTVQWAAMDFLRDAIRRNKRMVELRDLLLLALRTLAIILFVLAMARPYRVSSEAGAFRGQPLHAVLLMDNSLSMAYTQLDKNLLDEAKQKAQAFIEKMPKGSEVSVIPLAGVQDWHSSTVYATKEDAVEAVEEIEIVDRAAHATEGAERAREALAASPLPTKRVVFLGDMQQVAWSTGDLEKAMDGLGDVQVVQLSPPERSNTSVADFRLSTGVASVDSDALFIATLRHDGEEPRERIRVTLKIDGKAVDEAFVDMVPGQNLRLDFEHRFDVAGPPGEPVMATATLEITPDALTQDDFRSLVVPVVAELPVVFIDEQGQQEQPERGIYGETFNLRAHLAPVVPGSDSQKHLVNIRHLKPDEVTRSDLEDARLVVMAGVASPSAQLVEDLREFVQQGGGLLLAAGGDFDPQRWTEVAWKDGAGILPAPLTPSTIGSLPPPGTLEWPTFRLASQTFNDVSTHLELAEEDEEYVFSSPFFYKAVRVDEERLDQFEQAERQRLEDRQEMLEELAAKQEAWTDADEKGGISAAEQQERDEAERLAERLEPDWLAWASETRSHEPELSIDEQVGRTRPRVVGRYDNGDIFAVRRQIGRGHVVMLTSGAFPEWNNLAFRPQVLIVNQILHWLLPKSLPQPNLGAVASTSCPFRRASGPNRSSFSAPGKKSPSWSAPKHWATRATVSCSAGLLIAASIA